jgi:hypothetical protein
LCTKGVKNNGIFVWSHDVFVASFSIFDNWRQLFHPRTQNFVPNEDTVEKTIHFADVIKNGNPFVPLRKP